MRLPALDQCDILVERLIGRHHHRGWNAGALIGGVERNEAADADIERGAAHFVGMRAAGFSEAGGADHEHIGVADETAKVDVLGAEERFERDQIVPPDRDLERTLPC